MPVFSRLLTHTVRVERGTDTKIGMEKREGPPEVVYACVRCLLEPAGEKHTDKFLGRISQGKYMMWYETEAIRDADRIVVLTGPVGAVGRTFIVGETKDDTGRGTLRMQTSVLMEKK